MRLNILYTLSAHPLPYQSYINMLIAILSPVLFGMDMVNLIKFRFTKTYYSNKIKDIGYMEQTETKMNETIVEGHKFRRPIEFGSKNWERFTGWAMTDRPFKRATPIIISKMQKEN